MAGEKRERTRRRLVEAAFHVVAERGFHGASVDLIAARAGLSTGALYANFAAKDDLLFAAFEEHVRWFERSLETAVEAADLRAGISEWARALESDPDQFLVFAEFWAYAVRRPDLRAELTARLDAMRTAVADAIERRAAADGATPQLPPELAARVALALARGLAFDVLSGSGTTQTETIADLLAALVVPQSG